MEPEQGKEFFFNFLFRPNQDWVLKGKNERTFKGIQGENNLTMSKIANKWNNKTEPSDDLRDIHKYISGYEQIWKRNFIFVEEQYY